MKIRISKKRSKKMLSTIAKYDGVELKKKLKRAPTAFDEYIRSYSSYTKDGKFFRYITWKIRSRHSRIKIK